MGIGTTLLGLFAALALGVTGNALTNYIPTRGYDSIIISIAALGGIAGIWLSYEGWGWHTKTSVYASLAALCVAGTLIFSLLAFKSSATPIRSAGTTNTAQSNKVAPLSAAAAKVMTREEKEQLLRNSNGTLGTIVFSDSPDERLTIEHQGAKYSITMSMSGPQTVWVYSKEEDIVLYERVSGATTGETVDLTKLRPSKWHQHQRTESVSLAERVFLQFKNGIVIQLLLVSVRYYRAGDNLDEARFRYAIYEPGTHLIPALGPPAEP